MSPTEEARQQLELLAAESIEPRRPKKDSGLDDATLPCLGIETASLQGSEKIGVCSAVPFTRFPISTQRGADAALKAELYKVLLPVVREKNGRTCRPPHQSPLAMKSKSPNPVTAARSQSQVEQWAQRISRQASSVRSRRWDANGLLLHSCTVSFSTEVLSQHRASAIRDRSTSCCI